MRIYTLFLVSMFYALLSNTINAQDVDSIVDARDGQIYTIVKIGEQWWMAENLNTGNFIYKTVPQTDNDIIEKYIYRDITSNADIYGSLYRWPEMMQYDTTEGSQGICPNGWHIPTDIEWQTMEMALGMSSSDASSDGWRGTDQGTKLLVGGSSGFNALLSGYLGSDFTGLSSSTLFWTSTQYLGIYAIRRQLQSGASTVYRVENTPKNQGQCVRCIKDKVSTINDVHSNLPANINHFNLLNSESLELFSIQGIRVNHTIPGVYLIKYENTFRKIIIVD